MFSQCWELTVLEFAELMRIYKDLGCWLMKPFRAKGWVWIYVGRWEDPSCLLQAPAKVLSASCLVAGQVTFLLCAPHEKLGRWTVPSKHLWCPMFSKGDSILECYFQMPNWSLHKYPILFFFLFSLLTLPWFYILPICCSLWRENWGCWGSLQVQGFIGSFSWHSWCLYHAWLFFPSPVF